MPRRWLAAIALLAGCPGPGDDAAVDGGVDPTRLVLTWAATPDTPGPIRAGLTVHELHIAYSSVRLLGDAAPGDARTTRGATELEWDDGEQPPPIEFAAAPPGLYAVLELGVGGGAEAFAIAGVVDLAGGPTTFTIEDEAANPVSLGLAIDVRPAMVTTVPVVIDVAAVLAAVPFDELPVVAGHVDLRRGDPQMPAVRAALAAAVRIAGGAGVER